MTDLAPPRPPQPTTPVHTDASTHTPDMEHVMTTPIDTTPIDTAATDPGAMDPAAAARRQRVEELQRRRAGSTPRSHADTAASSAVAESPRSDRPARSGAAQSTKIAAAGLGFATMFGLVAAIAVAGSTSAAPAAPVQTAPPAQVVVVIHRADGTTDTAVPAGSSAAVPAVVATPPAASPAASPAQPIVLTAQPTVVQAPAAPAPVAQTHGSR